MNEKFVATNWFIFLKQAAQLYFQITINTTNISDYNYNYNGYYTSGPALVLIVQSKKVSIV